MKNYDAMHIKHLWTLDSVYDRTMQTLMDGSMLKFNNTLFN